MLVGSDAGQSMVVDDLMEETGIDKRVLDLFTKESHHRGITVLYLCQDLFPPGRFAKTLPAERPLRHRNQESVQQYKVKHVSLSSISRPLAKHPTIIRQMDTASVPVCNDLLAPGIRRLVSSFQ